MFTDRKMAILPKEIFRFNTVLSQFKLLLFEKNCQGCPKIHMKIQGIHNSQNNLEKEQENWRA